MLHIERDGWTPNQVRIWRVRKHFSRKWNIFPNSTPELPFHSSSFNSSISFSNKDIGNKNELSIQILVFSCYLAAYSDFFHESILCKSWNSDCDCDMYGSHIMLARFCQQHEAAVEEILEPSVTSRYCYCKNFCIYEKICRNIWM